MSDIYSYGNKTISEIRLVSTNLYSLAAFLNVVAVGKYNPKTKYACSPEWRTFIPLPCELPFKCQTSLRTFKRNVKDLDRQIRLYKVALKHARFNTQENIKPIYSTYLENSLKYLQVLKNCTPVIA